MIKYIKISVDMRGVGPGLGMTNKAEGLTHNVRSSVAAILSLLLVKAVTTENGPYASSPQVILLLGYEDCICVNGPYSSGPQVNFPLGAEDCICNNGFESAVLELLFQC